MSNEAREVAVALARRFPSVTERDLSDQLRQALATLTPREAQVLRMRFGLAGEPRHLLREAGCRLGISAERVRQVEAKALRKLGIGRS